MFTWLTNLFKDPKALLRLAVDGLDGAESFLVAEIDKIKARENFTTWTSQKQAERLIDLFQEWLRKTFKL